MTSRFTQSYATGIGSSNLSNLGYGLAHVRWRNELDGKTTSGVGTVNGEAIHWEVSPIDSDYSQGSISTLEKQYSAKELLLDNQFEIEVDEATKEEMLLLRMAQGVLLSKSMNLRTKLTSSTATSSSDGSSSLFPRNLEAQNTGQRLPPPEVSYSPVTSDYGLSKPPIAWVKKGEKGSIICMVCTR